MQAEMQRTSVSDPVQPRMTIVSRDLQDAVIASRLLQNRLGKPCTIGRISALFCYFPWESNR